MAQMKRLQLRKLELQELDAEISGEMAEAMTETEPTDWFGIDLNLTQENTLHTTTNDANSLSSSCL